MQAFTAFFRGEIRTDHSSLPLEGKVARPQAETDEVFCYVLRWLNARRWLSTSSVALRRQLPLKGKPKIDMYGLLIPPWEPE